MKTCHFLFCWKQVMFYICVLTVACNNAGENSAAEKAISQPGSSVLVFDKLVGTWQNEDGKSFERWTKNHDGTFNSKVFSIYGADTSYNEEALIYKENKNWVFENRVKNQNDGRAVKFTATQLTGSNVQFSNPAHDFPTDVNYTLIDSVTVSAFIIGPAKNGGKNSFYFNYRKLK